MRLNQKEITIIKNTIGEYLGKGEIYIFGSRLDENRRGGDIDIFFRPSMKVEYEDILLTRSYLKRRLLKPVDLVVEGFAANSIVLEALKGVKI